MLKQNSGHKKLGILIMIMSIICSIAVGGTIYLLYLEELSERKDRLVEIVNSQARLMEAISEHELLKDESVYKKHTLIQIRNATKHYRMNSAIEFTIAELKDDNKICWIVRQKYDKLTEDKSLYIDSKLAKPMRLALQGKSGIIIGLDYKGIEVLAAYEPVQILNLGLVAKTDMSTIRLRYIKAIIFPAFMSIVFIVLGSFLFMRIINSMIIEVTMSEEKYKSLFENIQNGFALHEMVFDEKGKPIDYIFLDVNNAFEVHTGLKKKDLIGIRSVVFCGCI